MHGEGVAHFPGGHVYKGVFSEGLLHGYGLYTWSDGVKYEVNHVDTWHGKYILNIKANLGEPLHFSDRKQGEFVANVPMGHGKYTWLDGSSYEGDIYNGIRHGIGTHRCAVSPVLYRGQWHRGKRQGKGVIYYSRDETSWYDGDWLGNKREGWGVRRYPSGNVYEGEWRDNARHGEGTMKWLTLGEQHAGTWSNGVQQGQGTHTWFVERAPGSQYPQSNEYKGAFVLGERHGRGSFHYASGERYQGEWRKNEKHGQGKFTFTNGRSIEREFADDRMVEVPQLGPGDPHHTPCGGPTHRLPRQGYASTLGPYMELDIDFLLEKLPASRRPSEHKQVEFAVLRHVTELRSVYSFYSRLGRAASPDNVFLLSRLQYWRLLRDCNVRRHGRTLAQLGRLAPGDEPPEEMVSPYTGILLPRLISSLVSVAYHTYHQALESQRNILAECFSKLMRDDVLPNAKNVKGFLFGNVARAGVAMSYMETCWRIYQAMSQDGHHAVTCRQLLLMFKDLNVFDAKLTPRKLLEVINAENPDPSNLSYCNLEQEVTFLEVFEVLLGCADVKRDEEAGEPPQRSQPSPDAVHPDPGGVRSSGQPPTDNGRPPLPDAAKVKSLSSTDDSSSKSQMEKSMEALNSSSFEKSEEGVKDHTMVGSKHNGQQESDPDDQVSSACVSVMMGQASALESESGHLHTSEATGQTGAVEKEAGESELDMWIQRTHLFFNQLFFPAYEHGRRLDQEVEDERRRQKAQRRIALAKAQEKARQREEELKAEEEEEKRRREEEEEAGADKSGVEDEVDGPSPVALTPVGSSTSLAPAAKGKRKKQFVSKGSLG
ncbi:Radial spoke head 10 B [Merluccius polli]|uniref:Radial spoke head 10 B n=1 Tax=Merluccius polli TaxID=89951 RepID=A0AA47MVY1_MERPO|nr:Radial spoke head 10 B [Merluccius polli]